MKKFTKILILLLALIAIVSAFTVVTFAAEETERPKPVTYSKKNNAAGTDFTFQNTTPGSVSTYNSAKRGVYYNSASLNGNKYLNIEYTYAADTNSPSRDIHSTYNRTKTPLSTHPIMSFDFDIMSEIGKFPTDTNSNATYFNFQIYKGGSGGSFLGRIDFANLGLSADPYEWIHLTYVFEYDDSDYTDGDTSMPGKFKIHFYVNGEKIEYVQPVDLSNNATWKGYGTNLSNVLIENLRIYAERFGGSAISTYLGFDNLVFNYFPADENGDCYYSLDEIGNYVYKSGEYAMPETSPEADAVITDADGKFRYYATVEDAIEAAVDGETVTLLDGATKPFYINKNITVKTALTTGTVVVAGNTYDFNYATTDGYVTTADADTGTVLTFVKSDDHYVVNWDPECDGECTCPDKAAHLLTHQTTVALGAAPYTPKSTEIGFNNGALVKFLGWTTVKGGTADDIVDITTLTATEAGAVINLYPVYDITRYDIEVIKNGVSTGYYASEYSTALAAIKGGGTIKLHADLQTEVSYTFNTASANITFDLNGYDFKRFSVCNHHYNAVWDEANGVWTKGSRMTVTTTDANGKEKITNVNSGVAAAAFYIAANDIIFTVTNSGEAANIYTYTQYRDTWHDSEGNVVGYDSVRNFDKVGGNNNPGTILFGYSGAKRTTIDIQGDGITYYGACLVLNEWGGNQNTNTVKINGGTYYAVVNAYTSMISQMAGGVVDVQNATFVTNGYCPVIRVAEKVNTSTVTKVDFKFTNCDIIGGRTQNGNPIGDAGIVLENCRYYASGESNNDLTLGRGTDVNAYALNSSTIAQGSNNVSYTYEKTYTLSVEKDFVLDENNLPTFVFTPAEVTYTFAYRIADPDLDFTSVTWKDETGEVLKTTKELKNAYIDALSYAVSVGDGWRGYAVTEWFDGDGKAVKTIVTGKADSYEFTAKSPEITEETEMVSCITGAHFNFIFYGQFHTLFYLPVTEGMDAPTVEGFNAGYYITKIAGISYWTYTAYNSTTTVSENWIAKVNFAIDGVNYSQNFKLSALIYADIILSNPLNDIESRAVANMVRYIKEARLQLGLEAGEKFDELIARGNIADLGAKEDYVDTSVDYSALNGYVESIQFMVDGSSAAYVIKLTDSAAASKASLKVSYVKSGYELSLRDSSIENAKYTINTRVYDLVDAIRITVTIPDANGGEPTVVSGTYSVKAYINNKDSALAKAMYEFGLAAYEYREYLKSL